MVFAVLNEFGSVTGPSNVAQVGITDMVIFHTEQGPALITGTRGGGYVVSYALGSVSGDTYVSDTWTIPSGYSQLETTDFAITQIGNSVFLMMAGLNDGDMQALLLSGANIDNLLFNPRAFSISGVDAPSVSEIAVFDGTSSGIIALRGGGLYSFDAVENSISTGMLFNGSALYQEAANDVATGSANGTNYAVACYWSENAISLFEQNGAGGLDFIGNFSAATNSAWFSQPMAAEIAEVNGQAYAVIAASGSSSLSVISIDANGGMALTDHVLDTRDTRFDGVSVFDMAEIGGRRFVFAAGADDGLSVLILLPGGRLHHVATIAGSADVPLNGITGIEVLPGPTGARIFVSTQAAPYLSELNFTLPNMGQTLFAADVSSTLTGGAGADILAGGAGDDHLAGHDGADILLDGAGADTLVGGAGADEFLLTEDGVTDVILDFQVGIDRIDLTALGVQWDFSDLEFVAHSWGVELLFGGDVLKIHGYGGAGITASQLDISHFVTLSHVTYTGDGVIELPDLMAGTLGNDTLRGGAEADRINGLDGNDRVEALWGDDTVWGESGNDALFGGSGNDSLAGGDGDDGLRGEAGFDTIFGDGGADFIVGGDHADELHGGDDDDRIEGGNGYDWLFGDAGNDTLIAGSTADRAFGGDGNDLIRGGTNVGTTVDGLYGEAGDDTIYGEGGYDFLDGGDGNDYLDGGNQADNLYGRGGEDTLIGGDGLDRLFGGEGNDVLTDDDGTDGLFGEQGDDTLSSGADDDRLWGGTGNDSLSAGSGNDIVFGGAGFDTIDGGSGDDTLEGNFNADMFVFADGHGNDTITDFAATNDFEDIDLSGLSTLNSFEQVLSAALQVGGDVVIDTGNGDSVTLLGVNIADLGVNDFVF